MSSVPAASCVRMKKALGAFSFLDEKDLPILADYLECRQVAAGEVLWREKETTDAVAFIVHGRMDITRETEFEGKSVVVAVYSSGSIAGELGLLDGSPRAVTAAALEDTEILLLSRDRFEQLINSHPQLGNKLLKGMLLAVSHRLKKAYERLADIF